MLADEVHLDLINKLTLDGRSQVEHYFTNYAKASPRRFELGFVDGSPAMLVYEDVAPDEVSYFVLLDWDGSNVLRIRDFLYASYALDGATITTAPAVSP